MGNYSGFLDVLHWSPKEYAQLAQDLVAIGQQYDACVNAAAEALNQMGASGVWTGYLYNSLVNRFNEKRQVLDDDAYELTTVIPAAISKQAEAQASASNAPVTPVSLAEHATILTASETADDGSGAVFIDPTAVEALMNAFIENLNKANENATNYHELFESTISKGWNVSDDIKQMESKISEIADRVHEFNESFKVEMEECAKDSINTMAAAQEASASQAQNLS
ncbi:MAG: hypothetical protein J6J36_07490 [Clostridia bacterium]|nr:hypothetical protein [Clostridia bacterium]